MLLIANDTWRLPEDVWLNPSRRSGLHDESVVTQGSPIGFTLTLPPEITLTESIRVQCKGRVVRVENGTDDGKLAVAAVIDEYEFLPEA